MSKNIYQRAPGITVQSLDDDLFLANEESGAIFHLNAMGAAFWQALETPQSFDDLVDLFSDAFPASDKKSLRRDLSNLAKDLLKNGLITQ